MKRFCYLLIYTLLTTLSLSFLSCTDSNSPENGKNARLTEKNGKDGYMTAGLSAAPGEDVFNVTADAVPDPFITYDNNTEYYYGLSTQNSRIVIHRSRLLKQLFNDDEAKEIYHVGVEVFDSIWAPEMYFLQGKWYIYTSATTDTEDSTKHLFVLESETADPFDGFHFKSFLENGMFAIDPTVYVDDSGKMYIAYSQVVYGNQNIGIAELSNPWTLGTESNLICKPYNFEWENTLDEGPFFLKHEGKLFIVYSANGCYNDGYCLGLLEFTGNDMLSIKSWTKYEEPIFTKTDDVFAPGHASFFTSPDGTETWIAYHCYYTPNEQPGKRRFRTCHVQKIYFTENGIPDLGEPLSRDTVMDSPGGESAIIEKFNLK